MIPILVSPTFLYLAPVPVPTLRGVWRQMSLRGPLDRCGHPSSPTDGVSSLLSVSIRKTRPLDLYTPPQVVRSSVYDFRIWTVDGVQTSPVTPSELQRKHRRVESGDPISPSVPYSQDLVCHMCTNCEGDTTVICPDVCLYGIGFRTDLVPSEVPRCLCLDLHPRLILGFRRNVSKFLDASVSVS